MIKRTLSQVVILFIMLTAGFSNTFAQEQLYQSAPQRVIVLELSLLDDLMLLGIKPIAIAGNEVGEGALPSYMLNEIRSIPSVGSKQQPSLTKIAALKPDLIIADTTFHRSIQSQLEKIAPTVMLNGIMGNPQTQLENIKVLAKLFHKQKTAEKVIDQYELTTAKDIKEGQAHRATVLMGYVAESGVFRALSANAIATEILASIGKENLIKAYSSRQRIEMTPEAVLAKNPQVIVILVTDNDYTTIRKLTSNPLWQQIPAVKANKVYYLSRDVWAQVHGLRATEIALDEARDVEFLNLGIPQKLNHYS
ncbi:ABC transporter substrate-binding protein [Thiotrichales bacterium 19S3-7]|nr:ABC transporter substrate-binding protein [Thiotrichales bacterium 19S3-7]MCF6802184.1 ABC transporter substrate-binding protein [Thiotrichales bacterium 19S3-11]